MKRVLSSVVGVVLILALGLTSIGCIVEPAPEAPSEPAPVAPAAANTGTVKLLVTDAPPAENVTSIMVTVAGVEIHRAVAEQEQEQSGDGEQTQEQEQQKVQQGGGEWIEIDIPEDAAAFDLLDIKGIEQFLGESEVGAGKYTQLRLTVDKIEVALGGGKLELANLPSGVLKFVRPFDVVAGETVEILIDFDADRSVNVTGAGRIQVKPVVKLEIKTGKQAGQTAEGEEAEEEEPEEVEFEGTIETIDGDIWTMTVDGETMTVDVGDAEIDGEPEVGLEAEVEGVMADDTVIASKVEIEEAEEEEPEED